MNTETLKAQMKAEYTNIMRYWIDKMEDHENGGFYGERDEHDNLVPNAPKGCILNGRILWTFSAAANNFGNPEYKEAAQRAFNYICNHFYDKENGGFYWLVDKNGASLDTKKQAYALGFVIYGLSEYYILTKDPKAIELAYDTYRLIEKHLRDPKHGGYIEAAAADWTPITDVRLSNKDENTPKSMNTHLHILEPYTNLYRAMPSPELEESIRHCINIFRQHIINPQTGRFGLFFDMDWTLKSNIDSYGHDIEGAWLIYEAAEVLGDKQLMDELKPICKRLVDVTIRDGFDGDSSIYYEKINDHLNTDKHWWPQAETLVGLTDTWRLTGDDKYLERMIKVWNYIDQHIIDHKGGDWFWRVDKNGNAVYHDMKAGFWKCPYHNSRAIIEVLHRLQ